MRPFLFLAITFFAFGCGNMKNESTSATDTTDVASDNGTTAASVNNGLCLWKELSVKAEPIEKGKYLTSLSQGEQFVALTDTTSEVVGNKRTHYQKIQLTDGKEGWVRADLIAVNARPATFIIESSVYKRPDLLTSTKKQFSLMDFVAVKATHTDGWVEVVGKRKGDTWFTSGWVKSESLSYDQVDVAFAILYARASEIEDVNERDNQIRGLYANQQFVTSRFVEEQRDTYDEATDDELEPTTDSTSSN